MIGNSIDFTTGLSTHWSSNLTVIAKFAGRRRSFAVS